MLGLTIVEINVEHRGFRHLQSLLNPVKKQLVRVSSAGVNDQEQRKYNQIINQWWHLHNRSGSGGFK